MVGFFGTDSGGATLILQAGNFGINRRPSRPAGLEFMQNLADCVLHIGQADSVLRTFGAGQTGYDGAHVEFKSCAVFGFGCIAEQALRFGISFNQCDVFFRATGQAQIIQGFVIDGENAAGRTVFGCHIGNRGAVGQRHMRQTGAEKLDKFTDHPEFAQHLRDCQYQIGRGRAFRQLAG